MIALNKTFKKKDTDSIGVLASSLCLVHCIVTPFIFIAQTCTATCCETAPSWWSAIDFLFIGISFFAVYWSTKNTSKSWIASALWISWVALSIVIINEKVELLSLPESILYIPALALVGLHLYNKKYCQCKDDQCCTSAS